MSRSVKVNDDNVQFVWEGLSQHLPRYVNDSIGMFQNIKSDAEVNAQFVKRFEETKASMIEKIEGLTMTDNLLEYADEILSSIQQPNKFAGEELLKII